MNIALIVTDAGPLITLAVADALDTLTMLGVRVVIPARPAAPATDT